MQLKAFNPGAVTLTGYYSVITGYYSVVTQKSIERLNKVGEACSMLSRGTGNYLRDNIEQDPTLTGT